jgi:hypothetical protein
MIPLLLLIGCVSTTSPSGLCDGLKPLAERHGNALVANGDVLLSTTPNVLVTGDNLLSGIRGGCK